MTKEAHIQTYATEQTSAERRAFSDELRRRSIPVLDRGIEDVELTNRSGPFFLFCSSRDIESLEHREKIFASIIRLFLAEVRPVLVCTDAFEIPSPLTKLDAIEYAPEGFDITFERVMRTALGPHPDWLELVCRPSQMRSVVGAAWWNDEVLFSDEYYDHVIRIKGFESNVIVSGLDEPYHISLDRRRLYISNLGSDEIISARIRSGAAWDIHSIVRICDQPLRRPHGIYAGDGYLYVGDTDNHRLMELPQSDLKDAAGTVIAELQFPCAVYRSGEHLWATETLSSQLHCFRRINNKWTPVRIELPENTDISIPVSLTGWRDMLLISNERSSRVDVYRVVNCDDAVRLESVLEGLGSPAVGSIVGMGVNRFGKLILGDRVRGCGWIVDIEGAMRDG